MPDSGFWLSGPLNEVEVGNWESAVCKYRLKKGEARRHGARRIMFDVFGYWRGIFKGREARLSDLKTDIRPRLSRIV